MTVRPMTLDEYRALVVKLLDDRPELPAPGTMAVEYVKGYLDRIAASAAKWGLAPDDYDRYCPECGHPLDD